MSSPEHRKPAQPSFATLVQSFFAVTGPVGSGFIPRVIRSPMLMTMLPLSSRVRPRSLALLPTRLP